jgi:hypothetical protein
MNHPRKRRKGAALATRPLWKISRPIADTADATEQNIPVQDIWSATEREKMLATSVAITAPPIVPDATPVLPMVAEAIERDRLARQRVVKPAVDHSQRRDYAASLAAAEFAAAKRRGRR